MIADLLSQYLDENHIEVWAISRGTGLSKADIANALENEGDNELSFSQYKMICDFIGVPIEKFIEADWVAGRA